MVDQSKRTMLKGVAGIGVGTVAMATSATALAGYAQEASQGLPGASAGTSVSGDLADIQVATRLSSQHNDLEIVLTNTGSSPANITDMTPAKIDTVRGSFDFNALFDKGSFKLEVGESVSVPIQRHAVVFEANAKAGRTSDLQAAIKRSLSIVTDGDSLAAIDYKSLAQFA